VANQSETTQDLLRTPLYPLAQALKARFTGFGGWDMAVQFSGITTEHEAVRNNAGMFVLRGKNLVEQLQKLVPSDLQRLQPGQAQYSVLLNPQGGIIDDIIFYYQGEDSGVQRGVLIVNAATTGKDKAWLWENLDCNQIDFQDLSTEKVLIAVQGPKGTKYLQKFVQEDLTPIKAFGHLEATVLGKPGFLARTGYTGEDGFEVMVDPETGLELWQSLSNAGVKPCGLGARDTLRLEAAMSLYGQDIDDTTTPLEAGLGWLVHLDTKGDFVGRQILERQKAEGLSRRLVGLQMQGRNIARHGYPVLFEGNVVGEITSGTLSPTLGFPVALVYVPNEIAGVGQELEVEIRGKLYSAKVVKRPFYRAAKA
jgi:aminomethyltransferase